MDTFLYGRICKCDSGNHDSVDFNSGFGQSSLSAGVIQPVYKG